jgi:hypothetical protein
MGHPRPSKSVRLFLKELSARIALHIMDRAICLFLCFKTESRRDLQLALDYWSGSEEAGKWKWLASVDEVASLHGVRKSDVPKLARDAADAMDLLRRCAECACPQVFSSRSSLALRVYGEYRCLSCLEERRLALLRRQEQEERSRFAKERDHIAQLATRNRVYRYDEISYFDAIVSFGIMLASDEACELGTFHDSDSLHLCPGTGLSSKLIARLFNNGILRMSSTTPVQAVVLSGDDTWNYYPHRVNWKFADDADGRSFPQIMSLLGETLDAKEEDPDYREAIGELWWKLAYDDALQHLEQEVDSYRLPDVQVGPKTESAIRHALENFSIPQVRREITNVVKNAAALSQHRDFARRHALNTIPGTLISYVDRAISEGWQVSPLLRNWQNEEPVLTTVLFNRVLGTGLPGFKTVSGKFFSTISQILS